jgi:hypothetical protein
MWGWLKENSAREGILHEIGRFSMFLYHVILLLAMMQALISMVLGLL